MFYGGEGDPVCPSSAPRSLSRSAQQMPARTPLRKATRASAARPPAYVVISFGGFLSLSEAYPLRWEVPTYDMERDETR